MRSPGKTRTEGVGIKEEKKGDENMRVQNGQRWWGLSRRVMNYTSIERSTMGLGRNLVLGEFPRSRRITLAKTANHSGEGT